jgi:hypothetical protein
MDNRNGSRLTEDLAQDLLARDGIVVIWLLHLAAGQAYRDGHPCAAETVIESADAAEQCSRRGRLRRAGKGPLSHRDSAERGAVFRPTPRDHRRAAPAAETPSQIFALSAYSAFPR